MESAAPKPSATGDPLPTVVTVDPLFYPTVRYGYSKAKELERLMEPEPRILFPKRISVVGSTGSGKTYLARELSDRLNLPFYELDEIRQKIAQKSQNRTDFRGAIAELVANDRWVIDGHYRDVRHLIWKRSDLVVHLDYSPTLILARLLVRFFSKRGINLNTHNRAVLATASEGISANSVSSATWPQRISRIFKTIRERQEYARILAGPDFHDLSVVKLESPLAAREWFESGEYAGNECSAAVAGEVATLGCD